MAAEVAAQIVPLTENRNHPRQIPILTRTLILTQPQTQTLTLTLTLTQNLVWLVYQNPNFSQSKLFLLVLVYFLGFHGLCSPTSCIHILALTLILTLTLTLITRSPF